MLALECLTGGRMYLCVCVCALEDTLNAKEKRSIWYWREGMKHILQRINSPVLFHWHSYSKEAESKREKVQKRCFKAFNVYVYI